MGAGAICPWRWQAAKLLGEQLAKGNPAADRKVRHLLRVAPCLDHDLACALAWCGALSRTALLHLDRALACALAWRGALLRTAHLHLDRDLACALAWCGALAQHAGPHPTADNKEERLLQGQSSTTCLATLSCNLRKRLKSCWRSRARCGLGAGLLHFALADRFAYPYLVMQPNRLQSCLRSRARCT